jgi:hypothetical protein
VLIGTCSLWSRRKRHTRDTHTQIKHRLGLQIAPEIQTSDINMKIQRDRLQVENYIDD